MLGVGLIGGSVALAARARPAATVTGYDASAAALAEARGARRGRRGVRRRRRRPCRTPRPCSSRRRSHSSTPLVGAALAARSAGLRGDRRRLDQARGRRGAHDDPRFVGGHPLAGAETAGVAHARADLFEGAVWYLTPGAQTSGELYERLHRLLVSLGAHPTAIDADAHDRMLASVSHLPHVLANVLVAQAAATLGGERLPATGPSFRDATRVAGAPSAIWTDIYLSNRDALLAELDDFVGRLRAVRGALERGDADAITAWNDAAAGDRRRLLEAGVDGGELFELRVSVPNRPGVIAQLALELGRAGVNITDMALYPTDDRSSGVVALWIAGEARRARATELLGELGYPVARP